MPERARSLRVRLTALVTLAVGLALALASAALVVSMSRSLVGDLRESAENAVDQVADDLRAGRPVAEDVASLPALTMIQIQDADGRVIRTIPEVDAEALVQRPISPEELAKARARAQEEADMVSAPSGDFVVASAKVDTPQGGRTVLAVSRLGPITASVDLVVGGLVIGTPLLTLLVGLLTWYAVSRALRPVEAIRRRAEAISHSTLDERLPRPKTGDEVARLTGTLNEMLDRIDEGARRQREFVSDASHELRTPLAAMRADLEVSLATRGEPDWRGLALRLLDDHRRLERLTGDLLMLARLDDGARSESVERVRLDEVTAGELGVARRAEPAVDLAPVEVVGTVPELARLVRNLLENADRHADERIEVRLTSRDGEAVLTVDDDGPGVPVDQRDRVFDRFYRLDSSRARISGGTGLGLAMVRRVARGHGGDAAITTSPLGGARVEVRLPLAPGEDGADGAEAS